MVSREFLSLANLFEAQTLCIHETTEIIVVRKYKNLLLAAFKVMTPCFKSFDNSQKLIIVGLVLGFCWNYFPQKNAIEYYWPKLVFITTSSGLVPEANWISKSPMA